MSLTPLDLTIAGALSVRRIGLARTILATLLLFPVYLWTLPPIACGCFAVPFRRCDYDRRYYAAAKSDLKNLASLQEIHFAEFGGYTDEAEELGFTRSNGVHVSIRAAHDGWAAVASHEALEADEGCAMGVGESPPYQTGSMPRGASGEITCTT